MSEEEEAERRRVERYRRERERERDRMSISEDIAAVRQNFVRRLTWWRDVNGYSADHVAMAEKGAKVPWSPVAAGACAAAMDDVMVFGSDRDLIRGKLLHPKG